jgi:hypothetical protein
MVAAARILLVIAAGLHTAVAKAGINPSIAISK